MNRVMVVISCAGFSILLLTFQMFAQNSSREATSSAGKDYSFTVLANQPWTDTGLDLQTGDVVQISVGTNGCGAQAAKETAPQNLPLPSAPAGSLIAKLHAADTKLLAVGSSAEFHIQDASRLFLGPNGGDCGDGSFAVKVHVVPANSAASTAQTQTSQADKLKQELNTAAEIFLQGQFGIAGADSTTSTGTSGNAAASGNSPTRTLKVSDTPLDSGLRRNIDGLPRRVNDQFKNLGDMVNFVLVGTEKQVKSALDAASWHVADISDAGAVLAAVMETYEKKDYLSMPMSTLYLFGRGQDYGYEMAEPIAMVASRHHFRLWKAPFKWDGQEVWVGAGTHDIGFAKDKRNGSVTHKIDPAVDGERTNIGQSLDNAGQAKSMSYYLPPNPVLEAKNATGDSYHSDGRILVVFLK
jgi:hypothetical protein